MAMARCQEHPAFGIKYSYKGAPKKPVGDGQAVICANCDNPGMIWLNEFEEQSYAKGERFFSLQRNGNGRIRVI